MLRSDFSMPAPLLSLIFVNYQSAGTLARAISSWMAPPQDFLFEIIVVNNDVRENAEINVLGTWENVRVENVGCNRGFGAGCNRGAALARGEWLFFLNPDTQYLAGTLTSLLPIFAAYPKSLGGVRLLTPDGAAERWSSGPFPTLSMLIGNHLWGIPRQASWERPTFSELDWVSGAALVASRTAFQELGGFDENYFLYFEDVDLAKRAKKLGIPVWYWPQLTVQHLGGGSHQNQKRQKQAYYQSEQYYFEKYRPHWEQSCLRWLHRLIFS